MKTHYILVAAVVGIIGTAIAAFVFLDGTSSLSQQERGEIEEYVRESLSVLAEEQVLVMSEQNDSVEDIIFFANHAFEGNDSYPIRTLSSGKRTYIYVIDKPTHTLVWSGGFPEEIGINVLERDDTAQERTDRIYAAATQDGSWVVYDYYNPDKDGEQLEQKEAFVISRGNLVIGAGIYE